MVSSDNMTLSLQQIKEIVKDYVLRELLPGEDPEALTDSTALMTGGILDSLATIRLTVFLEEQFQVQLDAHELTVDHLNTISDIARLVESKR